MLKEKPDFFGCIDEFFKKDFSEEPFLYNVKDVIIQVTDGCNLRCSYCYQTNKHQHIMSFDTAKTFIDYMFREYENENNDYFYKEKALGVCIEFIGGEPLLAADLIYQIIEYFEYQLYTHPNCTWGFFHRYNIASNGTLFFTQETQKILRDFQPFVSIPITVDGVKEYHDKCRLFPDGTGSYDLAVAAALVMKNRYNQLSTKITISPDNIDYIFKAVQNMYNLGFSFISINCCFEDIWGNTEEERKFLAHKIYEQGIQIVDWIKENNLEDKIYLRFLDDKSRYCHKLVQTSKSGKTEYSCGANWNMLALDYKGDLFPCLRFMNSSLNNEQPEYIIGNIYHGIGYTDEEKRKLQLLKNATIKNCSSETCINCEYSNGCGHCLGFDYQTNGESFKRATYFCYTEIAFGLISYYFNKITNNKEAINIKLPSNNFMLKVLSQEEINYLKTL